MKKAVSFLFLLCSLLWGLGLEAEAASCKKIEKAESKDVFLSIAQKNLVLWINDRTVPGPKGTKLVLVRHFDSKIEGNEQPFSKSENGWRSVRIGVRLLHGKEGFLTPGFERKLGFRIARMDRNNNLLKDSRGELWAFPPNEGEKYKKGCEYQSLVADPLKVVEVDLGYTPITRHLVIDFTRNEQIIWDNVLVPKIIMYIGYEREKLYLYFHDSGTRYLHEYASEENLVGLRLERRVALTLKENNHCQGTYDEFMCNNGKYVFEPLENGWHRIPLENITGTFGIARSVYFQGRYTGWAAIESYPIPPENLGSGIEIAESPDDRTGRWSIK